MKQWKIYLWKYSKFLGKFEYPKMWYPKFQICTNNFRYFLKSAKAIENIKYWIILKSAKINFLFLCCLLYVNNDHKIPIGYKNSYCENSYKSSVNIICCDEMLW